MHYIESRYEHLNHLLERLKSAGPHTATLQELKEALANNPTVLIEEVKVLLENGRSVEGLQILEKAVLKFHYNMDLYYEYLSLYDQEIGLTDEEIYVHFRHVLLHSVDGLHEKFIQFFSRVASKGANIDSQEALNQLINRIKNTMPVALIYFPVGTNYISTVRQELYPDRTKKQYFLNMYKSMLSDVNKDNYICTKYEMLKGGYLTEEKAIHMDKGDIIATGCQKAVFFLFEKHRFHSRKGKISKRRERVKAP